MLVFNTLNGIPRQPLPFKLSVNLGCLDGSVTGANPVSCASRVRPGVCYSYGISSCVRILSVDYFCNVFSSYPVAESGLRDDVYAIFNYCLNGPYVGYLSVLVGLTFSLEM